MKYYFDGSFAGYLTGVFELFERKEWDALPDVSPPMESLFFTEYRTIFTNSAKAQRVQRGLEKHLGKTGTGDFFHNFLSEDPKAWQVGYRLVRRVFKDGADVLKNYGDSDVLYFTQTLKKVSRERHRMKAFVRFSKTSDGLYVSSIEPDFNVLPLIVSFFRNRYADQAWLIYDVKRQYGMHYDGKTVREVNLTAQENTPTDPLALSVGLDERNEEIERLWKRYFKSTTIAARRNMKLHIQHVPKRYWKYLVEKQ